MFFQCQNRVNHETFRNIRTKIMTVQNLQCYTTGVKTKFLTYIFNMKLRNRKVTARSSSDNAKLSKILKKKTEKKYIFMPQRFGPVELTDFQLNSQFCDGTIICDDGVQLKVHRDTLSAVSPYFRAHFTNVLGGGVPKIEAKVNYPSRIFMKILGFAYSGHCAIEEDTVEPLLQAADYYDVQGVIQLCCEYISDQLDPANCLEIVRFAQDYFCSELEKKGKRYAIHNFVRLPAEGSEFERLNIDEVVEILGDDELNVRNEEIVFGAVQKWVNVNLNERKIHLLTLLKCIRLGTLTNDFVRRKIMNWSAVTESQECRDYLKDVLKMTKNSKRLQPDVSRPRIPYDILFAVGGSVEPDGNPTNVIETYDIRADRWLLSVDTDSVPRERHGLCALRGCIYIIGGSDGYYEYFNTVRCFDPINHKWKECASMHYPRSAVSVVMHDDKIYAMGGSNLREGEMSSAERYDPERDQWELIQPMQKPRGGAGAAALNDKIYIVGGVYYCDHMRSAEVYDPLADQWTYIPHMLSLQWGVSLIAFKNTLFALGGFNYFTRQISASGEKFTPGISAGWENIAEMLNPRSEFATVILEERIFVIGGSTGDVQMNDVEYYDVEGNKWFAAAPMNLKRDGLGACVLSGLPNARDYSFTGTSGKEVGQGAGNHQDVPVD